MQADVLIIGGGAAGLMCALAIKIKHPEFKVIVAEKNERVGKKLLATGNGRCNLGNTNAGARNYHSVAGDGAAFVTPALDKFSAASNRQFWESLGLLITEDDAGRQYPYTNQASSVLEVLRLRLMASGVEVLTDTAVQKLNKPEQFVALAANRQIMAKYVVLAAGGLASPKISNADGVFEFLSQLGHGSSRLFPALTQIKVASKLPKALKGLRIPGLVTLVEADKFIQSEQGELLFTDYGVSGIPAFQLSRAVSSNFSKQNPRAQFLLIDTLPQLADADIQSILTDRAENFDMTLENFLVGIINKKLGQQVLKIAGLSPLSRFCSTLTGGEIQTVVRFLKELPLPVSGVTGWQNAQVMAGGLLTEDFQATTLESKIVPGLFAIGEILDIDGDCGGYNLTWAWSSARLAAAHI